MDSSGRHSAVDLAGMAHELAAMQAASHASRTGDGTPNYERLFWQYVYNRLRAAQRRAAGHAQPWTHDTVVAKYRLPSIFRETDRAMLWLAPKLKSARSASEAYVASAAFHIIGDIALADAYFVSFDPGDIDSLSAFLTELYDAGAWPTRHSFVQPKRASAMLSAETGGALYNAIGSARAAGVGDDPDDAEKQLRWFKSFTSKQANAIITDVAALGRDGMVDRQAALDSKASQWTGAHAQFSADRINPALPLPTLVLWLRENQHASLAKFAPTGHAVLPRVCGKELHMRTADVVSALDGFATWLVLAFNERTSKNVYSPYVGWEPASWAPEGWEL